ncbi:receptor-interacting serine/threonine-protein kinase 1-like [Megalops cyprinoides]|uniref:receptor-interacting serine/threonine-protein kinase 1-like n=1 Tax=Megalops cyprinoides TaxID=118141 RepID=UPI001864CA56|nr:receptor-interacting serine/threonine-protein kinase 1-like [Megalops cyprinoides]
MAKVSLDCGGFGQVYLCHHSTHGQVVVKTIYTGPNRNERNRKSLMKEACLLHSLNHNRIVKLLGVVLEDGNYSLVMEFIPKGNLLSMLVKMTVPMSIKGRIILEILEGMVYLTNKKVIHKDLKPENILLDKDFHIKIADLGLAICHTWSKLTREESRRTGRIAMSRAVGTLSYMAPEHLQNINTPFTEKSDVYSFAIIIWVILTSKEPYANSQSDDHICLCVRNGCRPDETLILSSTPTTITALMRRCWHQDPRQRPPFGASYDSFHYFYRKELEKDVDKDLQSLMVLYEGPDDVVQRMNSLTLGQPQLQTDTLCRPNETGVQNPQFQRGHCLDSIQMDASRFDPVAQAPLYQRQSSLPSQPDMSPYSNSNLQSSTWGNLPALRLVDSGPMFSVESRTCEDTPPPNTSVLRGGTPLKTAAMAGRSTSCAPTPSPGASQPVNPQQTQFQRIRSWPAFPEQETACGLMDGTLFGSAKVLPQQESGGRIIIQQAVGIQIGDNNCLNYGSQDFGVDSFQPSMPTNVIYEKLLRKYEDCAVREEHLDLLRDNIGQNWKYCARKLGLTETEVETIHHDCYNSGGLKEMVHQMLEKWRMKQGCVYCTVGRLCRALRDNVRVDLLCQLLEMCQSTTTS